MKRTFYLISTTFSLLCMFLVVDPSATYANFPDGVSPGGSSSNQNGNQSDTDSTRANNTNDSSQNDSGIPAVEQIPDPARDENAKCDANQCPLIEKYVNPLIVTLTVLVGLAVVIGIIIGAIQVMTSAGDPQQAVKGKDHIRNAIIAVIVYVFLFAGLQFIIPGGFL